MGKPRQAPGAYPSAAGEDAEAEPRGVRLPPMGDEGRGGDAVPAFSPDLARTPVVSRFGKNRSSDLRNPSEREFPLWGAKRQIWSLGLTANPQSSRMGPSPVVSDVSAWASRQEAGRRRLIHWRLAPG